MGMKKTLLIVEDNLILCDILERWLQKAGYGVLTAIDEPSARRKIKGNNVALVLKSRKTKRDGCEKRNAFIETKTKCASNLIRKVTAYLQNQSKTPSLYIKINGIQMDF